jgi:hypothetical protein
MQQAGERRTKVNGAGAAREKGKRQRAAQQAEKRKSGKRRSE